MINPAIPKGPPPHATRYPWVVGQPEIKQRPKAGASIASDDYQEPEDMFSEGRRRLEEEGLSPKRN